MKHNDYPEIAEIVETVADFFYPGTNTLMQYNDFIQRYNCNISEEKYVDARYTLKLAVQKLKLPETKLKVVQLPSRPTLISIALTTAKGCSNYYKYLVKKDTLKNKIYLRDEKWHNELNCRFSVNFWDRARALVAKIDFDNQLRWLQYQIVRNSLQTNVIVSHFLPNVTKACTYCRNPESEELISHLYWVCPYVANFLTEAFQFIRTLGFEINPTRNQFIFGNPDHLAYTPNNFIFLVLKKYIWREKFKSATLNLVGFRSLFKKYISDLKYMLKYRDLLDQWNEWNEVFDLI